MLSEHYLLELIHHLYDAAGDPQLWPPFLLKLADAVGGTTTQMLSYDVRKLNGNVAAIVRVDPDNVSKYEQYYNRIDCWAVKGDSARPGNILVGQELCPEDVLARSEFYNDFLRPMDQFYLLTGIVRKDETVLSVVSTVRPQRAGPFSEDETRLLEVLMPHLQRAIQIHTRIAGLEHQARSAEAALDRLPIGCVLVNAKGMVVACNRSAGLILDQNDGLSMFRQMLCLRGQKENSRLQGLVRSAMSIGSGEGLGSGGVMTVARPSQRRDFQILVAPLPPGSPWLRGVGPAVAIFVSDPESEPEPPDQILIRLFGLTPAEARLAAFLMNGKSLDQVGAELRISRNTLRSQLAKIFQKTGTTRQGELIRLLLTSPAQVNLG
jgi:DNA-binding CsgD family transcriptional regulator/PAS domain-containing protein